MPSGDKRRVGEARRAVGVLSATLPAVLTLAKTLTVSAQTQQSVSAAAEALNAATSMNRERQGVPVGWS